MTMRMINNQKLGAIIVATMLTGFTLGALITKLSTNSSTNELKRYDGTDPNLPIYIGLDGLIYDVTAGKEFYQPGGVYHFLAGKDSSTELHIAGSDIIKRKYQVVGKLSK